MKHLLLFCSAVLCRHILAAEPPASDTPLQGTADRARILSQVKWTPVADTLPNRSGGFFIKGREYTGVPYSSVKSEGRYIGFDIGLRTFLAAVENPLSVLYTESLAGKVPNAAPGSLPIPANLLKKPGKLQVWLIGEHKLGRLKIRKDITMVP